MLISIRNNLLLILTLLCVVQCRTRQVVIPTISVESMRSGDVAFRLGRTIESDAIAAVADSGQGYSHVGVVVSQGDSLYVVHIEPERGGAERVKREPVAEFFHPAKAVAGCVARYGAMTERQRQVLERETIRLFEQGVVFDHDYSLSDTSRMYCTELVDYLFRLSDILLTSQRRRVPLVREEVIFPTDMLHGEAMQQVWYYDLRPARHN